MVFNGFNGVQRCSKRLKGFKGFKEVQTPSLGFKGGGRVSGIEVARLRGVADLQQIQWCCTNATISHKVLQNNNT